MSVLRLLMLGAAFYAAYGGPVLVLHGIHDDIIPVAHGRELARTARRGRLVELACAHNDCPPDRRTFLRTVGGFLRHEDIIAPSLSLT